MFDIGFWELSIIGVVALLVVGPERLPAMARTVGLYAGKLRRWVSQVRGEVERELRAEEIRQAMNDTKSSDAVRGLSDAMRMDGVKDAFKSAGAAIKDVADDVKTGGSAAAAGTGATSPAMATSNAEQPVLGKTASTDTEAPAAETADANDADSTDSDGKRERGAG